MQILFLSIVAIRVNNKQCHEFQIRDFQRDAKRFFDEKLQFHLQLEVIDECECQFMYRSKRRFDVYRQILHQSRSQVSFL